MSGHTVFGVHVRERAQASMSAIFTNEASGAPVDEAA